MNQYALKPIKQLGLFEGGMEIKKQPAKRVNIVSVKLVKESSMLYKNRCVRSPEEGLGHCHHPDFVKICRIRFLNYRDINYAFAAYT